MDFLKKYGPIILVVVAVLTLLLNIRQTQLLSKEGCNCKEEKDIGPL